MNKNRYLLYLLLCGFMLYYAVPRITLEAPGMEGLFAVGWILFAFLVVAGNLSAYLFTPRKQQQMNKKVNRALRRKRDFAN
jgi:hypothetical protein